MIHPRSSLSVRLKSVSRNKERAENDAAVVKAMNRSDSYKSACDAPPPPRPPPPRMNSIVESYGFNLVEYYLNERKGKVAIFLNFKFAFESFLAT